MTEFAKLPDCPVDLKVHYRDCKPMEYTTAVIVHMQPTRFRSLSSWLLRLTFWIGQFTGHYEEKKERL